MKKFYTNALWAIVIFLFCFIPDQAIATHLMGGQITYTHISGNTYQIKTSLYRDCDGINLPSSVVVNVRSGSTNLNVRIYRLAVNDVSLLCPGQVSECSGGTTPGIQEHVYQGNVTLNTPAAYTLSYRSCCRNNSITTLANPGNQGIYLSTQLNTIVAAGNSSPDFLNLPIGQFCIGSPNTVSPNGFDADGDVLVYSLVNARQNNGQSVNYATGFSGINPLTSSSGVNINPNTGVVSFTPSASTSEVAVLAIKAEEYRVINGVSTKIGEVYRDLQVQFITCSGNSAPVLSSIPNAIVQAGQSFCANVSATDDQTQNITLTVVSSIAPPATLNITSSGGGFTNGQFCFTPTVADQGNTYSVSINAQDDFCPTPSTAVQTFNITVPPPCTVSISTSSTDATCGASDGTATATLVGGTGNLVYSWTGPGGFTSFAGPTISGLAPGTYHVTITDGFQCAEQADIIVGIAPTVQLSAVVTNTSCGLDNGVIDATASSGTPPYMYSLSGGTPQSSGLFSNLAAGSYSLSVSDGTGCSDTKTYVVSDDPDIIPPTIVCPLNIVRNNDPGTCGAIITYSSPTISDNCPSPILTQVSGLPSGSTYPVGTTINSYLVTDGAGNTATCSFTVTVIDNESPTISCPSNVTKNNDIGVCGASVTYVVSASDNCPGASVVQTAGLASGSVFPVGTTTNSFTVTDAAGNMTSCSFTVTISDNELPHVLTKSANITLAGGIASVGVSDVDNGSSDNCGIQSSSVSPSNFTCDDIGSNTVTLTVIDVNGNASSSTATVNVIGIVPSVTTSSSNASSGPTWGGMDTTIILGYGATNLQLTATAIGGSSFSYSWIGNTSALSDPSIANPVFSTSVPGTYSYVVTVTNEFGCESTSQINLLVLDARCGRKNDKVLLCHNGNSICISPNAVPAHLTNHSGDYFGPCTNKTGISGQHLSLSAYPNPTSGLIQVEFELSEPTELTLEVIGGSGQLVYVEELRENEGHYIHSIDLSDLSNGLYIIKVSNEWNVETRRIQIQK